MFSLLNGYLIYRPGNGVLVKQLRFACNYWTSLSVIIPRLLNQGI